MSEVIDLIEGGTYYKIGFFDKELTIPSIETYIYDGIDSEHGHLFINAAGHVARVEGIEDTETFWFSVEDEEKMDMLDKQKLIEWLADEHSPQLVAKSYKYKTV